MIRSPIALAIVACALSCVGGCAKNVAQQWPDSGAGLHVIAVNERGESINPDDPRDFNNIESPDELDKRLDRIRAAIQTFTDDHGGDRRRVLVFVHGGMVNPINALNRSANIVADIQADGYYPIFIVWNSDLGSSYGEHLTSVRRGRYDQNGWWQAPFYLLSDLGRAAGRALLVWGGQIGNDIDRIGAEMSAITNKDKDLILSNNPQLFTSVRATGVLVNDYTADRLGRILQSFVSPPDSPQEMRDFLNGDAIHLSLGQIVGEPREVTGGVALFWLMLPVKLTTSPLLDAAGSAAWDNMFRRALILFDGFSVASLQRAASDDDVRDLVLNRGDGACTRLINQVFRKLALRTRGNDVKDGIAPDPIHPENGSRPYEITLIGHSMGSIVLNEFLRRSEDVDYEQVVYMAAACSVRDFQRSVIPYMEEHPRTVFHNLTLNPGNDVREVEGFEVPPRGSLLVWIDDMFASPYTPLDRTLGRWDNIVEAAYVIPKKLRGRVRLKAFEMYLDIAKAPPREKGTHVDYAVVPQKHGDFSECRFWQPEFREPAPPVAARTAINKYIEQTQGRFRARPTTRRS